MKGMIFMTMIPRKYYLDDFFDELVSSNRKDIMKCDIYEIDNIYNIEVDVPGFDKKDIKLECKDGYLIINIKKEDTEEDNNKNYIRRERIYGEYTRSFYLGEIDVDNIKAKFNNGILHVTIPKLEKQDTKRIIDIMD